jgi:hypothetical protein
LALLNKSVLFFSSSSIDCPLLAVPFMGCDINLFPSFLIKRSGLALMITAFPTFTNAEKGALLIVYSSSDKVQSNCYDEFQFQRQCNN